MRHPESRPDPRPRPDSRAASRQDPRAAPRQEHRPEPRPQRRPRAPQRPVRAAPAGPVPPGYQDPGYQDPGYQGADPWHRLHDESPESWRDRAAKAAEPFRRRKGGAPGRLRPPVVVGVVVVCLALLLGGGYLMFGAGNPADADERYLADVSVSEVLGAVEQHGFTCIPGRTIAQCEKSIQGADLSVTVHFTGETEVTLIEASGGTAAYAGQEADPAQLRGFFEMAARLPLADESGAVDAARAWAGEHVGTGGAKTFDGVRYEAAADLPLLTMRPA